MVPHPHALFYVTPTPLLSLGHKIACGPQGHEKHPGFGLSYRLRKPGGRGTSNSRQSRPLPQAPLREVVPRGMYRFMASCPSLRIASKSSRSCRSSRPHQANRPDLLLHRQPFIRVSLAPPPPNAVKHPRRTIHGGTFNRNPDHPDLPPASGLDMFPVCGTLSVNENGVPNGQDRNDPCPC